MKERGEAHAPRVSAWDPKTACAVSCERGPLYLCCKVVSLLGNHSPLLYHIIIMLVFSVSVSFSADSGSGSLLFVIGSLICFVV